MDLINFDYTLLIRLVVALILGGIIGLERGGNNHEAGLRTHMVLCLGSALVMVISICISEQYNIQSEVMRMSAQVLSGVGFLGAGSIIATNSKIRGITTAAGLWTTACIGITVGAGYYILAISAVAMMLFAMLGLRPLTTRLKSNSMQHRLSLELDDKKMVQEVLLKLTNENIEILNIHVEEEEDKRVLLEMDIKNLKHGCINSLINRIIENEGNFNFISVD